MLPEDFPEFLIRVLPRQKGHAVGTTLTILRFLSSRICAVSLWLDFCGKEIERGTGSNLDGREGVPTWKHLYVHKKVSFLLSVYVDAIKWSGKKQNLRRVWQSLNVELNFFFATAPISDQVSCGYLQRKCKGEASESAIQI